MEKKCAYTIPLQMTEPFQFDEANKTYKVFFTFVECSEINLKIGILTSKSIQQVPDINLWRKNDSNQCVQDECKITPQSYFNIKAEVFK